MNEKSNLPEFKPRSRERVIKYLDIVFSDRINRDESHIIDIIAYEDGHFRVVFDANFFTIQPGKDTPSKSQWNSLKKKMKRVEKQVFIFKEHGEIETDDGEAYYIDFGFFAHS